MKIIAGDRATGKTTALMKESAQMGYPILVHNNVTKENLKERAADMGYDIPTPIVATESSLRGFRAEGYLVDQIDIILPLLLDGNTLPLKGFTVGGEDGFDISIQTRGMNKER